MKDTVFFKKLDQLQQYIFSIYLQRDYLDNHYFYEKEWHLKRLKLFSHMQFNNDLPNQLVEIISALGHLRYRMEDQASFEMCERELKLVSQSLSNILKSKALSQVDLADFLSHIEALENIFKRSLQVALKEPMLFVILIQYLHEIHSLLMPGQ